MRNILSFLRAVMVSPLVAAVPVPGPGEAGTQRYTSLTNAQKKPRRRYLYLECAGGQYY